NLLKAAKENLTKLTDMKELADPQPLDTLIKEAEELARYLQYADAVKKLGKHTEVFNKQNGLAETNRGEQTAYTEERKTAAAALKRLEELPAATPEEVRDKLSRADVLAQVGKYALAREALKGAAARAEELIVLAGQEKGAKEKYEEKAGTLREEL